MKNNQLVIELFNDQAIKAGQRRKQAGVKKFGLFTKANLPKVKGCLIQHEINASRIFKDKNLALGLLLITDPEGNQFELISPASKQN